MENQPQSQPTHVSHTTTIVVGKQKSVGLAFVLAFLFGPLGLLYASILGGIIMFVIGLILFFLLPVIGAVFCWIGCIIWAIVAAQNANKTAINSATTALR